MYRLSLELFLIVDSIIVVILSGVIFVQFSDGDYFKSMYFKSWFEIFLMICDFDFKSYSA